MLAGLVPCPGSLTAAAILQQVFRPSRGAFRLPPLARLRGRFGRDAPVITAIIHDPGTFVDLIRDPSPGNFAEAYVASRIDLEGDLFAGMEMANVAEDLRLSLGQRLRIFASLWSGRG